MKPTGPLPALMRSSLTRLIKDAIIGALALVPPASIYRPSPMVATCEATARISDCCINDFPASSSILTCRNIGCTTPIPTITPVRMLMIPVKVVVKLRVMVGKVLRNSLILVRRPSENIRKTPTALVPDFFGRVGTMVRLNESAASRCYPRTCGWRAVCEMD